jgi:single-strand DNA-binding protein
MAMLNKVMLIGRLTDNPEPPRVLPNSGSTLVKFRFAVGRSKKNPQTGQWENDPNPLYIDCEAFTRPDATFRLTDIICQYCTKGSQVYVEGKLQLDTWDDKNNPGQKRSKHKVVVEAIQLLDTRGAGQGGGGQDGGYSSYGAPAGGARPPAGGNRGGQNFGPQNFGPDDHDMGPSPDGGEIPF